MIPSIITYLPDTDFNGNDSFTYEVCDSGGLCDTATVNVTINAVNDAPEVTVDLASQTVQYSDGILPVTVTAVDIDSPGDDLTVATTWNQDGGNFTTGLPTGLTLSITGSNNATIPGEVGWTLSGTVNLVAGTYIVQVTVGDGADSTVVEITLIVEPEDVMITFHGGNVTAVPVDAAGSDSSQSFQLIVHTRELYPDIGFDVLPGDISLDATFIGSDIAEIRDIVVDSIGQAIVTGSTASLSYPLFNPLQPAHGGLIDAYITKLSADGSSLVFSTYFGGNSVDAGYLQG